MYCNSLQVSVTSFFPTKNRALQPPQKSDTHTASGWLGHWANWQGSTKQKTLGLSGGQMHGHLFLGTHVLLASSMTCPLGHSHLRTHCLVHIGFGLVQVAGQAEAHSLNTWPLTGHSGGRGKVTWSACDQRKYLLGGGHLSLGTHVLLASSMTCPLGHSHLATHSSVHIGLGIVQLGGQAEPHSVNTWPLTGHFGAREGGCKLRYVQTQHDITVVLCMITSH